MNMTYRHSNGSGGHEFYPGVVGDPQWDDAANSVTITFEDGETRTFGPNPDGEPIAYGRLLFRDETFADSDPDGILYRCTFEPVA